MGRVDKSGEPVEVGSLSHYLRGLIHPRWCRISAINSSVYVIELFVAGEDCMITLFDTISCSHV